MVPMITTQRLRDYSLRARHSAKSFMSIEVNPQFSGSSVLLVLIYEVGHEEAECQSSQFPHEEMRILPHSGFNIQVFLISTLILFLSTGLWPLPGIPHIALDGLRSIVS